VELVVDDSDLNPNVSGAYIHPLEQLHVPFTYLTAGSAGDTLEPVTTTLKAYQAVVWFTGDYYGSYTGPSAKSEAILASWLDGGGCLFISSQDYFYNRGLTSFMQNYLGAATIAADQPQTVITGTGALYGDLGVIDLDYAMHIPPSSSYSDVISPTAGTETAFFSALGTAAVYRTAGSYHTAFWGVPFETVPTNLQRRLILERFLKTCNVKVFPPRVFLPVLRKP